MRMGIRPTIVFPFFRNLSVNYSCHGDYLTSFLRFYCQVPKMLDYRDYTVESLIELNTRKIN